MTTKQHKLGCQYSSVGWEGTVPPDCNCQKPESGGREEKCFQCDKPIPSGKTIQRREGLAYHPYCLFLLDNPQPPDSLPSWQEEFYRVFKNEGGVFDRFISKEDRLIEFITNLLATERENLLKLVEGLRMEEHDGEIGPMIIKRLSFNMALDEVKAKLKEE